MPTDTVDLLVPARQPNQTPMLERRMNAGALSGGGCRSAGCHDRVVARNRIRRRLRPPGIFRPVARGRRGAGGPAAPAGTVDRRLPVRVGRRRADGADRRRRRLDRRRGGGSPGRWPIPDQAVAVLAALPAWAGAPGSGARGPGGAAYGVTAARRRTGGDDRRDAGVQPAVAGRRAGPLVARPVATAARRHGGGGGLRRAELRRAGPAGRTAGRGGRGRRSDPPAAGRCRLGRRRAACGAADGDAGPDRRGPRRAGCGVPGRARLDRPG